jgi:hypothetical protein
MPPIFHDGEEATDSGAAMDMDFFLDDVIQFPLYNL